MHEIALPGYGPVLSYLCIEFIESDPPFSTVFGSYRCICCYFAMLLQKAIKGWSPRLFENV